MGLSLVRQTYPQYVPNDVRVPPTENLPQASFRFHLTTNTLALR